MTCVVFPQSQMHSHFGFGLQSITRKATSRPKRSPVWSMKFGLAQFLQRVCPRLSAPDVTVTMLPHEQSHTHVDSFEVDKPCPTTVNSPNILPAKSFGLRPM
jgi:hypothetical protein